MLGGGQDGGRLAQAFAQATLPPNTHGVIMAGPFMPQRCLANLRRLIRFDASKCVLKCVSKPMRLLRRADQVIAMGGYNTICEILAYEKPALIVPRVIPRREQLVRAERLHSMELIDMLYPDSLSPESLTAWMARDVPPPRDVRNRLDFAGLQRIPYFLEQLLNSQADSVRSLQKGAI
jgi:predicted glycosyltransferase